MSDSKVLSLKLRDQHGKNKVDKLRVEQLVPGVIYSKGEEARSISAVAKEIQKAYEENGTSNIMDIDVEGKSEKALFKDIQRHPYKNQILHFDLFLVDMNEKLRVQIPVVLEGRDSIKVQPSNLIQVISEIEIECLPADLPSEAIVNVEDMQIGDSLTIADLDVAKNDKIEVITELEEVVATLQEPRDEVEEEVDADASAEVPTVSETEEE